MRGTEFVVSVRQDAQALVAVRTGAVAVFPGWADFMGWREKHPEDSPLMATAIAASMRFVALPEAQLGAAAPEQPALLTISVSVQPADADIYLNGSLAGKGNCTGFFSAGEKLTFVAKREGYVDKSLSISVDKDTGGAFEVALERAPEKVSIRTVPEDAEILLDGAPVGKGSYAELVAPGATCSFALRREGYADTKLNLTVQKGATRE